MAAVERDGEVWVLDLGDTENRFNGESVAELGALLDEVQALFDGVWRGAGCAGCRLRDLCPSPLDTPIAKE